MNLWGWRDVLFSPWPEPGNLGKSDFHIDPMKVRTRLEISMSMNLVFFLLAMVTLQSELQKHQRTKHSPKAKPWSFNCIQSTPELWFVIDHAYQPSSVYSTRITTTNPRLKPPQRKITHQNNIRHISWASWSLCAMPEAMSRWWPFVLVILASQSFTWTVPGRSLRISRRAAGGKGGGECWRRRWFWVYSTVGWSWSLSTEIYWHWV